MKKKVGFVFVSLLVASFSFAQTTSFGVKAGLNIASLETSAQDYDGKAGLHVGGLAHIHITRHFAFQPELVFSMQGGEADNTKVNLNYLNIPLLAQYMSDGGFRIETGPQLGFLTTAKAKTGDVTVDIKDNLSSTDFSWAFGVGYLFPQGFGIDGRYNLGLNNITDDNDVTIKNRVFQVGVFYQFPHTSGGHKK